MSVSASSLPASLHSCKLGAVNNALQVRKQPRRGQVTYKVIGVEGSLLSVKGNSQQAVGQQKHTWIHCSFNFGQNISLLWASVSSSVLWEQLYCPCLPPKSVS